jgi:hypothetical protein
MEIADFCASPSVRALGGEFEAGPMLHDVGRRLLPRIPGQRVERVWQLDGHLLLAPEGPLSIAQGASPGKRCRENVGKPPLGGDRDIRSLVETLSPLAGLKFFC